MFSELDILNKELENDDYKLHCMIECSAMQLVMDDDIAMITEAEGEDGFLKQLSEKAAAAKEKIKQIIEAVKKRVKEAFVKLRNALSSKYTKEKYDSLMKRAKELESTVKDLQKQGIDLSDYLADDTVRYYKMAEAQKALTTVGDSIIASVKNIDAAIKGGKKVTADDISEIRSKIDDYDPNAYVEEKKINMTSSILNVLGMTLIGATGGALISALWNDSEGGAAIGAFLGSMGALAMTICDSISTANKTVYRRSAEASSEQSENMKSYSMSIGVQVTELSNLIATAEISTYRKAIEILSSEIPKIESAINKIEKEHTKRSHEIQADMERPLDAPKGSTRT